MMVAEIIPGVAIIVIVDVSSLSKARTTSTNRSRPTGIFCDPHDFSQD